MSQSTRKPLKEQLNTQNSTEETATPREDCSKEKIHTYEEIPYTPFYVVGNPEKGYIAVCGTYQLTPYMKSKEEIVEYVNSQPYELLITLMSMVITKHEELKNIDKNMEKIQKQAYVQKG